MTALRTFAIALTSIILSAFALAATAVVSVMVAVASGEDVTVPGLVEVSAGSGSDLASASVGNGLLLWFVGVAVVVAVTGVLWFRRRGQGA